MCLRDASSGKVVWKSENWHDAFQVEKEAKLPKSILKCKAVSREVNFKSTINDPMDNLRLVQKILLNGQEIEEWQFKVGFVIPQSVNTWQSTIEAAPSGEMLTPQVLSGNVIIETTFYNGDTKIGTSRVKLYYV
ncbi:Retinal rod rhodopsin-sensitive cGMP 3',5'-cyclic phosphodiesterase subunit delta [Sorochytrium milnesiophthora]